MILHQIELQSSDAACVSGANTDYGRVRISSGALVGIPRMESLATRLPPTAGRGSRAARIGLLSFCYSAVHTTEHVALAVPLGANIHWKLSADLTFACRLFKAGSTPDASAHADADRYLTVNMVTQRSIFDYHPRSIAAKVHDAIPRNPETLISRGRGRRRCRQGLRPDRPSIRGVLGIRRLVQAKIGCRTALSNPMKPDSPKQQRRKIRQL